MGDTAKTPDSSAKAAKGGAVSKAVELSAAEAAKVVKRERPVIGADGKPTGETEAVAVTEDEVFCWSLRGETVTVVTIDGQKLVGTL